MLLERSGSPWINWLWPGIGAGANRPRLRSRRWRSFSYWRALKRKLASTMKENQKQVCHKLVRQLGSFHQRNWDCDGIGLVPLAGNFGRVDHSG